MYESLGTLNFGNALGRSMVRHVKNKKSIPRLAVSKSSLLGFGDDTTDSTDSSDSSFDWNSALTNASDVASAYFGGKKPAASTPSLPGYQQPQPQPQSSNMIYYALGGLALAGGAYFFLKK